MSEQPTSRNESLILRHEDSYARRLGRYAKDGQVSPPDEEWVSGWLLKHRQLRCRASRGSHGGRCRTTRTEAWQGSTARVGCEGSSEAMETPLPERKKRGPGLLIPERAGLSLIGAEHRVRTGDLRLGNEHFRRARRFSSHHETARPVDYIRFSLQHRPASFHGSPRGFSPFMCPICARLRRRNRGFSARHRSSCGAAPPLNGPRLRLVRTRRVASQPRSIQRDQVRLPSTR